MLGAMRVGIKCADQCPGVGMYRYRYINWQDSQDGRGAYKVIWVNSLNLRQTPALEPIGKPLAGCPGTACDPGECAPLREWCQ